MKRSHIFMLAGGALVLAAGAWLIAGARKSDTSQYRFATIERGDLEATVSSTGTLNAVTTVQVGTQVSGKIVAIHAAHEQLAAAEAQLKAAELSLKASEDRYGAGASTLVELTQARATQVDGASAVVTARYNEMFQRTLIGYFIGALDPGRLAGETQ